MSNQEQDAITGRMVREHGEAVRKLVTMEAELDRYSKAFALVADALRPNIHDDVSLNVTLREIGKPPLADLDFGKLAEFLREYTELRKSVTAGKARLTELGVPLK